MSQTATTSASLWGRNASRTWSPRLPRPMKPSRTRSLAPRTFPAPTAVRPAIVEATVNWRRLTFLIVGSGIMSGQVLVHLRQEAGEIQAIRARGAGGLQVGARPVARLGRHGGVLLSRLGSQAVVLVIGEEPREIAQLGLRPGGDGAAAVAIGAEGRAEGQGGVAEAADVGLFQGLEPIGRVGVLA